MRSSNLSRLFAVMVNDIYQIFNTTILEVNIIVPVTPKFTDKKTATKQSEMT